MRVAVVLPVRNRPSVVVEALDSIAGQTSPPHRVHIVDDDSTDDTADRVAARIAGRDGWTLTRQEKRTIGATRRAACAAVADDADAIAFLDSDDLWPPDYLARVAAAFARAPDALVALADRQRHDYPGPRVRPPWRTAALARRPLPRLFRRAPSPPCFAVRTGAGVAFDDTLDWGEDLDLLLRLALRGPFVHAPGAPVVYRTGYARSRGEAPMLSERELVAPLRQIEIAERRLAEAGLDRWRHTRAYLWYRAGRALLRAGDGTAARAAYKRSLDLFPWSPRTWWIYLTTKTAVAR